MCDITNLVLHLHKVCFIHGPVKIRIILYTRNLSDITKTASISSEEDSAVLSAKEKLCGAQMIKIHVAETPNK
jgi:hypothetical protein